jgi:hypothetical protein
MKLIIQDGVKDLVVVVSNYDTYHSRKLSIRKSFFLSIVSRNGLVLETWPSI